MSGKLNVGGRIIAFWIMIALVFGALSPVRAAAPPDSGAALNSIQQPEKQVPGETAPYDINIPEPGTVPPAGSTAKIHVAGFRFSGETILPEKKLLGLITDRTGQDLTLDDLNNLAAKITRYIRGQGYLVAFACIPAQHIKGGVVEIVIVPGKYGVTKINNQAHIKTAHLQALLSTLKPGAIVTKHSLERVLLLLNDLAGIRTKAALTAGQTPGTTDLIVDVSDGAKVGGDVNVDNWGSRYTGQNRGGVQLSLNNLAQFGDALHLSGLTTGDGMTNGNCDYALPLGDSGLKLNLKYSHVNYALGADFAALDASGAAAVYGAGLSYPLIRSRAVNLYGIFGFDGKQLKDVINSAGANTPRTSSLWNIGISGNTSDTWGNGGLTAFTLTYSWGNLTIHDNSAAATDASTADTPGSFHKVGFNVSRQQVLGPRLNLDLWASGQLADKNLDSSEKFYLGGADGVRAYPQGEAAGDQGFRLTAELTWRIPKWSTATSSFLLSAFSDYGSVTINKNPWDSSINTRSLCDAGLGVIWNPGAGFNIRCDYAFKIGNEAATSDNEQGGRFWIRAVKSF